MRATEDICIAALAELNRLAATALSRRIERVAFRDTLMIAFMALRPLRLNNFANLTIGRDFVPQNGGWEIRIPPKEVKTRDPIERDFPPILTPYLDIYLIRVRRVFAKGLQTNALWLEYQGAPLKYHTIYCRFTRTTTRLLGVSINPHLFRHCAATSLATHSPAAALAAGPLLGHRNRVTTDRYYVRANRLDASRKINAALRAIGMTRNERLP
jgi:integrase